MAAVASGRLRSGTRIWTPEALTPGRSLPPRTVEAAADALVDALAEAEARPGGREAGRPGPGNYIIHIRHNMVVDNCWDP